MFKNIKTNKKPDENLYLPMDLKKHDEKNLSTQKTKAFVQR
jgi:hypothetical protein